MRSRDEHSTRAAPYPSCEFPLSTRASVLSFPSSFFTSSFLYSLQISSSCSVCNKKYNFILLCRAELSHLLSTRRKCLALSAPASKSRIRRQLHTSNSDLCQIDPSPHRPGNRRALYIDKKQNNHQFSKSVDASPSELFILLLITCDSPPTHSHLFASLLACFNVVARIFPSHDLASKRTYIITPVSLLLQITRGESYHTPDSLPSPPPLNQPCHARISTLSGRTIASHHIPHSEILSSCLHNVPYPPRL